ncbi:Predicted ATPase [Mycobacteroides abscessus subsp. abscessus]|uniref:ATP-binding protein n=1 Tax=Mycobacteroides abscessus TaxID=36809 RepID=UPI00092B31B1|nr:ATP-binding protein [Mycobacteroides abscessus]SIK94869.1 Predicted ATPase [Mycobacteroides abscessus subsp. abscessus]SLC90165.1 Predicted ATPase [Mycobacteroides abscessus subsp. abscessus]
MGGIDGGGRAASGLFYQYLFTIEKFLALIADSSPTATEVKIEGPRQTGIRDPDIIDFAVYSEDGVLAEVHQVKSVAAPSRTTISAGDALRVLARLATSADCPTYVLTTNARPGDDIELLNTILGGTLSNADLMQSLRDIAAGNAKATEALSVITADSGIAQLRRSRVNAAGESSAAIRRRIRTELHKWRSLHGLPLGEEAAHVLENCLIADIFGRAAGTHDATSEPEDYQTSGPDQRTVTLEKFTRMLGKSVDVLGQVAGVMEAGRGAERVPIGDEIERPDELDAIVERFGNLRSRQARRCTLTGPSGVGKTRLAAMYTHNEADTYDRVCWIDAQSEISIAASILNQSRIIGIGDIDSSSFTEIATAFKGRISSFIGRWLIVFDNAQSARQLAPWMVSRGNADVLVTSTNSAVWGEDERVPVDDMDVEQARSLLRSRLNNDLPDASPELEHRIVSALDALAVKLARRPLALHIAASHFVSLSTLVHGIASYTDKIDALARVLGDDSYDRGPYPRTFQAAIDLCIDTLENEAHSTTVQTALGMLAASSTLASHNIPAYLVFASATKELESLIGESDPRTELERQLPELNAAIQCLRTQSLVERSNELDADEPWELSIRLEVNEIVQYVIRRRLGGGALAMNITAAHLSTWLANYVKRQDFSSALVLQAHALNLLTLAKDTPGDVHLCAQLAGNTANFLLVQGLPSEALELARFEMDLLKMLPTPHYKSLAKTADVIVQALARIGAAATEIIDGIESAVNYLQAAVDEDNLDWDGADVCGNLLMITELLTHRSKANRNTVHGLETLREELARLQAQFENGGAFAFGNDAGTRQTADQRGSIMQIEHLLTQYRHEEALAAVTRLLAELDPGDHIHRIAAKNLLLESLAHLDNMKRLEVELEDFLDDLEAHRQLKAGVWHSLCNTAFRLAVTIAIADFDTTSHQRIFRTIVGSSIRLRTTDYERYAHILMAACQSSHDHDVNGVRILFDQAAKAKPNGDHPLRYLDAIETWLRYWLYCAERGLPAHAIDAATATDHQHTRINSQRVIFLHALAPALKGKLKNALVKASPLEGHQWIDSAQVTRGLDIRESSSGRTLIYLLLDEVGRTDSDGKPIDPFQLVHEGTTVRPTHLLLRDSPYGNTLGLPIALYLDGTHQ